jgi:mRNA deadenylase 3'-5' endonuclease subunit Ccr4
MSVMSYNVLAESLVAENMWLYGKVPPEWLEWTARRTRLIHEISRHSVCHQHVTECAASN